MSKVIASTQGCVKGTESQQQSRIPSTKVEWQSHGELNPRRAQANPIMTLNPSSAMAQTAFPTTTFMAGRDNQ